MKLYTSLVRLKQAMNGGELPPMTDVPAEASDHIDPAFTIGLGALEEDRVKGLRCPVRGCGRYFETLTKHLNCAHPELGATGLRLLLEIPRSAPLTSSRYHERRSAALRGRLPAALASKMGTPPTGDQRVRQAATLTAVRKSVGWRNLRDRCEAQMAHKLIDLQHALGHSPSGAEAEAALGVAFVGAARRAYGTWNAAKAQFGLEVYRPGRRRAITREAVLAALCAYHDQHGRLPSRRQASAPTRTPMIPGVRAILLALGDAPSWTEAMRRAAAILDIHGGRYGLLAIRPEGQADSDSAQPGIPGPIPSRPEFPSLETA